MNDNHVEKIRRIMICVNRIDGIYYKISKSIGIKENTLSLFYALSDGRSHTQKEICDEWLIPRTTINTVVRECVRDGYVRLQKSSHSKEKELILTDTGQKYVGELMEELFRIENASYAAAREAFGDTFVEALHTFTNELEARTSETGGGSIRKGVP